METEDTRGQHKGKGGAHLKKTTEHFEMKYRAAANAETIVQLALATDGDIDVSVDAETLARKTLMDSMEPKAHVSTILASAQRPYGGWQSRMTAPGKTSTDTKRPAQTQPQVLGGPQSRSQGHLAEGRCHAGLSISDTNKKPEKIEVKRSSQASTRFG